MVTVIFGNEPYSILMKKKRFREIAKEHDVEVKSFSTVAECFSYFAQASFLEYEKYAILYVPALKDLDSKAFRSVIAYAGNNQTYNVLVEVGQVNTNTKFYKELEKDEKVTILPSNRLDLQKAELALDKILRDEGVVLPKGVIKDMLLRTDYGNDKNTEVSLINLKNYAEQMYSIGYSKDTFYQIVPDLREAKRFSLANLIVNGDMEALKKEISKLSDKDAPGVLGLLHSQIRTSYLNAIGISYQESGGRSNAFSSISREKLLECLGIVLEEQHAFKSGLYSTDRALNMACMKILDLCNS